MKKKNIHDPQYKQHNIQLKGSRAVDTLRCQVGQLMESYMREGEKSN